MVTGLWFTHDPNFGSLSRFWRCKEHPCPLSPDLEVQMMVEVPDRGLASWSWFRHGHFGSLTWFWRCNEHPCPLSTNLELWRTLEVPDWGLASWSWFWYDHLSLIYQWSKFRLSILILKVQRPSMSLKVLILGFGKGWRLLTGVWYLDLDMNRITVLWYNHDPNFGSISWFWRCKEHPCPLSLHLGL